MLNDTKGAVVFYFLRHTSVKSIFQIHLSPSDALTLVLLCNHGDSQRRNGKRGPSLGVNILTPTAHIIANKKVCVYVCVQWGGGGGYIMLGWVNEIPLGKKSTLLSCFRDLGRCICGKMCTCSCTHTSHKKNREH